MSTPTAYLPPRVAGGEAQRLARDAAAAAEVRTWQTHPDVVALRVEGIRTQVDRLMWAGIVLGLCFTMTNVQQFAAAGAAVGSLAWWSAWLLDPMVSLVLLAVLRAEQVTTRYQVPTGAWPRAAKWALLSATYVMNTWVFWAAGSASGVILHSVPPLVVVTAAEAVTDVQHALTDCVHRAHTAGARRAERVAQAERDPRAAEHPHWAVADDQTSAPPAVGHVAGERPVDGAGVPAAAGVGERARGSAGERSRGGSVNPPARSGPRVARSGGGLRRSARGSRSRAPVRRKLLADYVGEARAAWTPEVVVSPAWVRQVTDCSRGLSSKVAAALNTELAPTHPTTTTALIKPEGRAA